MVAIKTILQKHADEDRFRAIFLDEARIASRIDHPNVAHILDLGEENAGDLAAALKAFTTADSIMHVPTTGLEVARTQDKMGQLVEARETLLAVLRIAPQPSDPPPFAEARRAAEALDADLARRIPSLIVEVSSELPGAITVIVDEQTIAPNLVGIARKLNPGKHVVVARGGGEEARETVTIAPSETKRVSLRVAKKAPSPTHDPGPGPGPSQPRTEHERKLPLDLPLVSWIGFGVGAAGLVTGTVTGIVSLSKTSDATKDCVGNECPRSAESALDSANTFATISNIGFAVAVAGAAVGVVGMFVLKPAAETKPASARLVVSPGGIAGTF